MTGAAHSVDSWKFLLFVDHSIAGFAELPPALRDLARQEPQLKFLVVVKSESLDFAQGALGALGLSFPVLAVAPEFYADHNVWAMPFAIVLGPGGEVRINSLVPTREDLFHAWHLAIGATSPSEEARGVGRLADEVPA